MKDDIIMIKVADIKSHPDNPRKDLGDLTELTESIKKNGIMQNLTVIPSLIEGKYIALIGHRRLAAAAKAGIEEVPCKVVKDLEKKEQVAIMLEENMQRNDLTITEQAFGFQMMLDLGESEKSIAEKTGFSRSTVRSRLQIAKLNPILVQEATEQYQITIADLAELQKIKSVERRNKVLEESDNRWALIRHVNDEIRKERMEAALELLKPVFNDKGITKGTGENNYRSWDSSCQKIKSFKTSEMPSEIKISVPKDKKAYWTNDTWSDEITVYYFTEDHENHEKKKEDRTAAQKEAEKRSETKAKINALMDDLQAQEAEFIRRMIDRTFKIKKNDELDAWKKLWPFIRAAVEGYYGPDIKDFFQGDDENDKSISEMHEAIITAYMNLEDENIENWGNYCNEKNRELHAGFKAFLEQYGFSVTGEAADDIAALLDGTSDLYTKEDE